ncbi:MAG: hypothetical protein J07HQX50_00587 [Haloquadratum sp. J07HQX50]|nr:MAG: hypothetical protein J07HQX50_00587 [Haloquadratum sp. J07HQX50]
MSAWVVGSVFDFGWKPWQTNPIQSNPTAKFPPHIHRYDSSGSEPSLDSETEHRRVHDETRGFSRPANLIIGQGTLSN